MEHGPLVLLGAVWLAVRQLRRAPAGSPGGWRGVGLIVIALGLHVAGFRLQTPRLSWFAGALLLLGWVELGAGWSRARALFVPLAFLTLSLSWGFLDTFGLGFHLRLAVTAVVEAVVNAFGAQVLREGTNLIPVSGGTAFEVAAACAGLRSLTAVLATAVLLGQLQVRGVWRHLLLLVSAAAVVWVGNVIRVTLLVFAGLRFGVERAQGWHDRWGFLVFLFELGVVAVVAWRLREKDGLISPSRRSPPGLALASVRHFSLALGLILVAMMWIGFSKARPGLPPAGIRLDATGARPTELPVILEGRWGSRPVPLSKLEAEVLPPDTAVVRRAYYHLARPESQVLVTVVLAGADRTSIHRPELCLTGSGWTVEGRRHLGEEEAGLPALLLTLRRLERAGTAPREALMLYWFVGQDGPVAGYPEMLWTSARERLAGDGSRWSYFAVQTLVGAGDPSQALQDAQEVSQAVFRALDARRSADISTAGPGR